MTTASHSERAISLVLETVLGWQPHGQLADGVPPFYSSGNRTLVLGTYQLHFDYLWSTGLYKGKGLLDVFGVLCRSQKLDIVLINDSQPPEDRDQGNVGKRTTVFDFLVAACLSIEKQFAIKLPDIRVFLIDLSADESRRVFGGRMFYNLLSSFEWVRVFPIKARQFPVEAKSLSRFFSLLYETASLAECAELYIDNFSAEYLFEINNLLRSVWSGELGRAEEHHDVANLLGPLVLFQGLGDLGLQVFQGSSKDWRASGKVLALAKLMVALDAFSEQSQDDSIDRRAYRHKVH
jgi:hypothetical protein